jgi:putative hemolysin
MSSIHTQHYSSLQNTSMSADVMSSALVNQPAKTQRRSARPVLQVRLAQGVVDVRAAQRLRAQVFGAEFGIDFPNGIDEERLDTYCAHLLVHDGDRLIATTRLMDRHRARLAGGFYTSQEFDLTALLGQTTAPILEIGRTCVHPEYRSAAAINALWQGIGMVVADWKSEILMGCASVSIGSGDCQGWLDRVPEHQRLQQVVRPKRVLPKSVLSKDPTLPPLLKAYMRMNAQVGTQACFDPVFHCADVFVWMPLAQMDQRYFGRFGQQTS